MTVFALAWVLSIVYSATLARTLTQGRFLLPGLAAWAAAFAVSVDGRQYSMIAPHAEALSAGDAATYGYWLPVLCRIDDVPDDTRYLRIEFRSEVVRLARVELEYGEDETMDAAALRRSIEDELRGNILPFWRDRSVDHARGGFIAEMANDGTVRADAPKGLILNARLLWTFSALHRQLGDERDLELARRAYRYLEDHFRDREHGGYFWRVEPAGRPLDRDKKIYGQAFAIYALSEYHLATGENEALDAARGLFALIERNAHDARNGGYLEARAADWSPTAELRLGDGEPIAAKSMNTHLHLLEAYTNLYRAWPNEAVATRLRELIGLFTTHVIGPGPGPEAGHLRHFFDERWNVLSDSYTYGHDIEAVWLLSEAATALGDEELERSVRERAVAIARTVLTEGLGAEGGLAYEGRGGAVIAPYHDWWCQAEAVVGFWQAFELTGEGAFAGASGRVWEFISRHIVDEDNGDWFWRVRADGTVDRSLPKVSEWKAPYHNTRMCLEMLRRLDYRTDGR
jgi:mannobiose 2-epimerase